MILRRLLTTLTVLLWVPLAAMLAGLARLYGGTDDVAGASWARRSHGRAARRASAAAEARAAAVHHQQYRAYMRQQRASSWGR